MRRRQAGSITPVWLTLVMATLFLLILFVDREWVNYQLRKAKQTADFAAEAGAATAQITYKLWIEGEEGHLILVPDPNCKVGEICDPVEQWSARPWSTTCSGTLTELTGSGWIRHCGCNIGSAQYYLTCFRPRELSPDVQFPATADATATATFNANWVDRPNSRVTGLYPYKEPGVTRRLYRLTATLRITSLFGNWWPAVTKPIPGASTLKIPPLRLSS